MLVVGFPSGPLQANCYLLAPGEGSPCVVVDPGQDVVEPLAEQLRKHRLTPVAVLLTHGHFDHCFSVAPVCDGNDIPAWVHPEDRALLSDPGRGLGVETRAMFGGALEMREPAEVRELSDGAELDLGGLRITVAHTPGHTGGSVSFHTGTEEGGRLMLSGDTLFAGSIGRTDLPGGDHRQMLETLRTRVLPLPDDTVVLPGHGPTTTIGRERVSNPFLLGLDPDGADAPAAPHRGL
ncbi:Glyoxylase, beta-lactamase superfamily II [Streptoalloteichus tenebrarius]|uniref:Glyoxylase, beta-lactamase superfamily II n=1 Tax=Streptoalloteichus tenebrarius (strain ATCC 17920 / DSM 40477 / JCM 4838 / CBS 697.72 / NBRC 16177 / NCIMB 11028 / NRRL B-12390 / A12253. 1 / ISP 5477) TaxID=1933 RepID=A0ABT1HS95_STRSD|nr:MBL fold metallo-hydrolase [Streptoalloteichus tenebrarius]MCP2258392.1 Glyoxylase, beta-lactamase superfamily II [Streptoalloteichus tenebrarius]BFF03560.1 MBL fold metallo-hydrolase [Streptoalloteichus tenebrarius]